MPTPMPIPAPVLQVMNTLSRAGFHAYLVGGCVRDHLRGLEPHDYDMTTDATPTEMREVFAGYKCIETGLKHGTVTVLLDGEPIEITTYRLDGGYTDHRHPEGVTFTRSLTEDLARRDFTVNAIAYSPEEGYIDPFHGLEDLDNCILRAVGDPDRRFEEDALRILRAVRFASVTGFEIEEQTKRALMRKRDLLTHISAERIREELTKLLTGEHVLDVLLTYPDVLAVPLPEIAPMVTCGQNSVYHIYTVWEHTARVVAGVPATPVLRWSALLHDVAKPPCKLVGKDGRDHFYGHPKVSAEMADAILHRLKFDNKTREKIVTLVYHHDDRTPAIRSRALRLLSKVGYELFWDLIDITIADSREQNPEHPTVQSAIVTANKLRELGMELQREGAPYRLSDLAISGADLLAIGYPAGKEVGETLSYFLREVMEDRITNDREELLSRAAKRLSKRK